MENHTIESESGPRNLSILAKLTGIFTNPGTTFESIKQKPDVWFPVTLMVLIAVIGVLLTTDLQQQASRDFINNSEIIPEERKADMLDNLDNQGIVNTKVVPAISGAVGVLIYYAVIAFAFLLFGNFIYGGNSSFKNMFALAAWGSVIGLIESVVKVPLMLSKGSMEVFTSPAILMDVSASNSIIFKILDGFDIFVIWKVIVFSIGFSVFYKMARSKSYTAIITLYVVYLVIAIGLSQLFKGFIS